MLNIEDLKDELDTEFVDKIQDIIKNTENEVYFSDIISDEINDVIPYNNGKINDDLIVQYLDVEDSAFIYENIKDKLLKEISNILDGGYELDNEELNTLNKYNIDLYDVFEGNADVYQLNNDDVAVIVVILYDSLSEEMKHSIDVLTNTSVYQSLDDYLCDKFEDMGIENVDVPVKEVKEQLKGKSLDDMIKNVDVKDTPSKEVSRDELEL